MNKIMNSRDMNNLDKSNTKIDKIQHNLDKMYKGKNQNRIKDKILRKCKIQDILLHKLLIQLISLN